MSVLGAVPISLNDNSWQEVAKKRLYSHKFGFGKLDASKIVEAAKTYKLANDQVHYTTSFIEIRKDIPQSDTGLSVDFEFKKEFLADFKMRLLEHITVSVNIEHGRRGDIEITLRSPNGYISQLSTQRRNDFTTTGYHGWKFMTVKHWDENPVGIWTITVFDKVYPEKNGRFISYSMSFWGESSVDKAKNIPVIESPKTTFKLPSNVSTISRTVFESYSMTITSVSFKPTNIPQTQNDSTNPVHDRIDYGSNVTTISLIIFSLLSFIMIAVIVKCFQRKRDREGDYEFQELGMRDEIDDAYGVDDDDSLDARRLPNTIYQNEKDYYRNN